MSRRPSNMTPEQRRKLIAIVLISDVVVFGLVFYFLILKPAQKPQPSASPSPTASAQPVR